MIYVPSLAGIYFGEENRVISNSSLQFYPLVFVTDRFGTTVGRIEVESYATFPDDGVALLKQMQMGLSPAEAAQWYAREYGESLDIEDFLAVLDDLQFLRSNEAEALPSPILSRALSWQWLGRAAFSPPAYILYALLFGGCIFILARFPLFRPTYQNIFFTQYITIIDLFIYFTQIPLLFFHEFFHVLAGRRLGLRARLSIGYRLYFVVFETQLPSLWSVPRRARYLPFLAGMLADILLFSLLIIVARLTSTTVGQVSLPGRLCLALAFSIMLRFIWQFSFFLQTDLYYVFSNAFGCVDLQNTTRNYLRNIFYQLTRQAQKKEDPELWNPQDRQMVRWYAGFYVLGCAISIGTLLFAGIPIAIRFLSAVFVHLFAGAAIQSASFWDALVFLALNVLQLSVVLFLFFRNHKRKRTKARSTTTSAS